MVSGRKNHSLLLQSSLFALGTLFLTSVGRAEMINYGLSVDDYCQLKIDGVVRGTYDAVPAGGITTGTLDLAPGWHDIEIDYKNRWGSNELLFYTITETIWPYVPLESMRSQDGNGNWISGLRADYYDLSANFLKTIYGEGPIVHCATWNGGSELVTCYEGEGNITPWGGIFNGWSTFEERLSGQILVGAVPEPTSALLLIVGATALLKRRRMAP